VVVVSGALLASAATSAQTLTNPPGTVRGVFGGEGPANPAVTSQQLSTWFDLSGGYDNNEETGAAPGTPATDGYASTFAGALRYWRGRTARSFEASGRVFRNNELDSSASGGELNVIANAEFHRRTGISMTLRAANESARLFGGLGAEFTPLDDVVTPDPVPVADVSPPTGIVTDRWLSFGGSGRVYRNWTPRHRTSGQYNQLRRRPQDGPGLDNAIFQGLLQHDWNTSPNVALLFDYRYDRITQQVLEGVEEPVQSQSAEFGVRYERRLNPVRTFSFSVTGGATLVSAVSTQLANLDATVEPTGMVLTSYSFARNTSINASASRRVSVLSGISLEPFANDIAAVSFTNVLFRRLTAVLSGSVSRGLSVTTSNGSFRATTGTATLQYGFRYGGVFAGYSWYQHRLTDVLTVPGAVPQRFDRQSARAGMTLFLPLFGGF
jgi:hypothetical protein